MPPCIDVYVWVPANAGDAARAFAATHVTTHYEGRERLDLLLARCDGKHVDPNEWDAEIAGEDGSSIGWFESPTLYSSVLMLTADGGLILGGSIDEPDPDRHPKMKAAKQLAASLMQEHGGTAALIGTELPPPASAAEWESATYAQVRIGSPQPTL